MAPCIESKPKEEKEDLRFDEASFASTGTQATSARRHPSHFVRAPFEAVEGKHATCLLKQRAQVDLPVVSIFSMVDEDLLKDIL